MSEISVQTPLPHGQSYLDIHQGSLKAIDDEVSAVMESIRPWGGDAPAPVAIATMEGVEGEQYVYRLEITRQVRPPEYTAIEVTQGGKRVRGLVEEVSPDGRTLHVTLEDQLKERGRDAVVIFDPTQILRKTAEIIASLHPEAMPPHPRLPMVEKTLGLRPATVKRSDPSHESIRRRGFNNGQVEAIATTVESDLGLIFGPPGTGKTRTLGSLVAEMVSRERRILVTAHTNAALDTAMASVMDALGPGWKDGRVVRMGKLSREFRHLGIGSHDLSKRMGEQRDRTLEPALTKAEALAELVLPVGAGIGSTRNRKRGKQWGSPAAERTASVASRIAQLAERVERAPEFLFQSARLGELRAAITTLRKTQAELSRSGVGSARVVGATLSSLVMRMDELGSFDSVVIDEGSMAGIAQVAVAASFAQKQVVILGDPKQLPPVVMANTAMTKAYLKRDPFRHLGLDKPSQSDPRRPILTVQHRMAPAIREFVSNTFYDGLLEDGPAIAAGTYQSPLVLIDTSASGAQCKTAGSSRVNETHAEIVARLVKQLHRAGETDIGMITPFRPQARLIEQTLSDHGIRHRDWGNFVSTIHRSQGGEKSTIIFDSTDAPPRMGGFLNERFNEDLAQLMAVALSRAQTRLVILAHTQGFRGRYGRSGALIMRIFEEAFRRGTYLKAERVPDGASLRLVVPEIVQPELPWDMPEQSAAEVTAERIVASVRRR